MKRIFRNLLAFTLTFTVVAVSCIAHAAAVSDICSDITSYAETHPDDYVSFAAAVVENNEILFSAAYGYADRESGLPADANTVYEWGSVSKLMVWVSVMQLWEQGKLNLEADVRTYLPDGFLRHLSYDQPITMLDLMNHTGGWGETVWALQTSNPDTLPSFEEALKATEPAQILLPGTVSSYSNWGAALAAYIVERVSGENYAEYAHKHILEPLGMAHTSVAADFSDNPWVREQREKLVCYAQEDDGWVSMGPQISYIKLYPVGSVTGTIRDMALFAQGFVSENCPLFEKKETLEAMLTPSFSFEDAPVLSHGLMTEHRGENLIYGHDGATNGCMAGLWFEPSSGTAVAVMMNGAGAPVNEVRGLVFGASTSPGADAHSAGNESSIDISGRYFGLRAMWHGPLKCLALLETLPVKKTGTDSYSAAGIADLDRLDGDLFLLTQGPVNALCRAKTLPDGSKTLDLGGQSFKTDRTMMACRIVMFAYAAVTGIGAVVLLIQLILRLVKKRKMKGWATTARIMRVVSIIPPVLLLRVYGTQYGITRMQGYLACNVEMACVLCFSAAMFVALRDVIKGTNRPMQGASLMVNGFSVFALFALELVRFWGI